jgi:tetratricopeptide (TPR) repeat protein
MGGEPMPADDVLRLTRPVCEALAYAHAQGVLHRDIKPSNIMVTKDGSIFVTDFGLARMVEAGESTLSQDMMVGTPQYISPEQAQGVKDLDGRTDVYSMGVVLYEMLTGRVPFSADTPFATVHDHIYTPLPPPSTINPQIDPTVERMLLKALSKDPQDRYATAKELLDALETSLGAQIANAPTVAKTSPAPEAESAPIAPTKKRRIPWWAWAGGATLVLCVCLAGLLFFARIRQNRLNPPPPPGGGPVAAQPGGQPAPPPNNQPPPPNDQPQPPPGDQPEPPRPPADEPPPPPGVDPDSPEYRGAVALTQEGIEALERRNPEAAIELFEEAIELEPRYVPAYFGLSEAFIYIGEVEESIAVLEDAAYNNPDDPAPLMRLGEEYLLDEDPEAALEVYGEAADLVPNMAAPYAGQALALMMMDEDEEAREALDEALALDPLSAEARLANALYMIKHGDRREALEELRLLARDQHIPAFVRERARQMLDRFSQ